jgi:invasion associated locus B (IalB) protein
MSHRTLPLAVSLLVLAAASASAQPQSNQSQTSKPAPKAPAKEPPKKEQPQRLGGDKSWSAYSLAEGKGKICYLVGEPAKKEPAALKRDRVNALVTHNTADKSSDVVSFVAGAPFAERADAELEVDGKKFSLFTDKDTAWARDPATDKAIVTALAKGKQAVIKGPAARGGATMTDTYNLAGLTPTLALIDKACSIKEHREPAEAAKKKDAPAKKVQ